jgi:2-oxoglutarate ferredoxin oxidoreductase subunit gamma
MSSTRIRLSGTGGQGLILAAGILARALLAQGKQIAQSQSYEPTSRGGVSRADLIVSDARVDYPLVTEIDYLLILDQLAVAVSAGLIADGATVLADTRLVPEPPQGRFRVLALPVIDTALQLGNARVANVVSLGALAGLTALCASENLERATTANAPPKYKELNLRALHAGFELARTVIPVEETAAG